MVKVLCYSGTAVAQWLRCCATVGTAVAQWLRCCATVGTAVAQRLRCCATVGTAVAQRLRCCATVGTAVAQRLRCCATVGTAVAQRLRCLWSETCWSNFKYFITILTVSTNYIWIKIDQLHVTCFIIILFTAQRVSNVSTSIFRSLRLIVLYCSGSMCVGVTVWFGWGGVVSLCRLKH